MAAEGPEKSPLACCAVTFSIVNTAASKVTIDHKDYLHLKQRKYPGDVLCLQHPSHQVYLFIFFKKPMHLE